MDSKQLSKLKSFDIKMEKTNAIFKYRRLQKITTLFRFIEMFVFLVIISRFSSQLPSAVQVFGDYFRGITFTVFISPKFVFVIGNVIILILFLKSRSLENGNESEDLCYEYVNTSTPPPNPPPVIVSINKRKIYRSRSEKQIRVKCKENQTHRELRRSVTEISRLGMEKSYSEDDLSSEDFRRTVEAFIARQQKILRDEEFSPMVCFGS